MLYVPMNLALDLLVVAATVLGSWMAFPQARRIARTRRVDGVSGTWIGVSLAINGWWLSYGLVGGSVGADSRSRPCRCCSTA
jgi:hypothetical protein